MSASEVKHRLATGADRARVRLSAQFARQNELFGALAARDPRVRVGTAVAAGAALGRLVSHLGR